MADKQYVPSFHGPPIAGASYYGAKCPNTQETIIIDPDPSRGKKPHPHGYDFFPCQHCQQHHKFAASEIFSFEQE